MVILVENSFIECNLRWLSYFTIQRQQYIQRFWNNLNDHLTRFLNKTFSIVVHINRCIKAYLYFFPRGHTEFAVIYLSDTEDETTYTLIVNPLNASVEVRDEIVDYEEILNEWNQETDAST